jgi:hypothetical protein
MHVLTPVLACIEKAMTCVMEMNQSVLMMFASRMRIRFTASRTTFRIVVIKVTVM